MQLVLVINAISQIVLNDILALRLDNTLKDFNNKEPGIPRKKCGIPGSATNVLQQEPFFSEVCCVA